MNPIQSNYIHKVWDMIDLYLCVMSLILMASRAFKGQPGALSSRYVRGRKKGRTTKVYCTQSYHTFSVPCTAFGIYNL